MYDLHIKQDESGGYIVQKEEVILEQKTYGDVNEANKILSKARTKLKIARIGLLIAVISTCCLIASFVVDSPETVELAGILAGIAVLVGLVAYIVGGGIIIALKAAYKIGMFGWLVVPFPIDIITGICTFIIAILVFLFLPIIFVSMRYMEIKKEYDTVNLYISSNM